MARECKIPEAVLRRHLAQGMCPYSIGLRYGWCEGTIRDRCRGLRIEIPGAGHVRKFSDTELRERIYDVTKSLGVIADELGVSTPAIVQRARRLGLPTSQSERLAAVDRLGLPRPERMFRAHMGRRRSRSVSLECAA